MRFSSRSQMHKGMAKKAFLGAVLATQLIATGIIGYAASGGDMHTLGMGALTTLSSVFTGAVGAAIGFAGTALALNYSSKKNGSDGLSDTAAFVSVGTIAGGLGYIAGSVAGPAVLLSLTT